MTTLLETFRHDYDFMFLDCPPGFSLLTEGIFAAADAVLVPAIPTVLSLRTVARLIKRADRAGSRSELVAFFNMVDRRRALHRRACTWSLDHPEVFLQGQIPYASVVEQMGVRRLPLARFAPRDSATTAFAELWMEFLTRLQRRAQPNVAERHTWVERLQAVESLIARIESAEPQEPRGGQYPDELSPGGSGACVVHSFDTENRDLQRRGHVLELREREGHLLVVAARAGSDNEADLSGRAPHRFAHGGCSAVADQTR